MGDKTFTKQNRLKEPQKCFFHSERLMLICLLITTLLFTKVSFKNRLQPGVLKGVNKEKRLFLYECINVKNLTFYT